MALDIGTLVAKLRVDDGDFEKKSKGWSTISGTIASAFGNVAANAISSAASSLMGFVSEAAEASDATDKFKKTLEFAGLDGSKIAELSKSTRQYADETVYSLTDIQSITAQLASNGVEGYDSLAMSLGNLNAIAGGNADTFGRVGMVVTQTAGAGKLTTENWNQLAEAIPGASGKLQEALLQAGAYTGNFRDAMAAGEITAEEFNDAIQLVGTDPIAVEAAKSTETFEGSLGNLQASLVGVISDILTKLKPAFTEIVNTLANVVSWIGENADWLGPLAMGIGIAVAAIAAWTAVQWLLNVALTANPIGLIVVAIGLLIGAIILLVQNWDTVVAWLTEVWQGFVDWIVSVIDGFVAWWNEIWAAVGSFFSDVWDNLVNWVRDLVLGWIMWQIEILVGFLSWWNGLWASVGQFFTDIWNGFVNWVQGLVQGYVSFMFGIFAGFLSWWNGLWSSVGSFFTNLWNNLVNWVKSIPQAIINVFAGAGQWLFDAGKNIVQGLWNGLKNIWNSVSSWFQDTIGGMVDTVKGIFGIASPSKVFFGFGLDIGQGLINGLAAMEPAVSDGFESMVALPDIPVQSSPRSDGPREDSGGSREFHYHAAPNASLDAKEELFAALGSPRVGDL